MRNDAHERHARANESAVGIRPVLISGRTRAIFPAPVVSLTD